MHRVVDSVSGDARGGAAREPVQACLAKVSPSRSGSSGGGTLPVLPLKMPVAELAQQVIACSRTRRRSRRSLVYSGFSLPAAGYELSTATSCRVGIRAGIGRRVHRPCSSSFARRRDYRSVDRFAGCPICTPGFIDGTSAASARLRCLSVH